MLSSCESYRDQEKVRQRKLLSLVRVEVGKLEQLAEATSKHTGKLSVLNLTKDAAGEDSNILGAVASIETDDR